MGRPQESAESHWLKGTKARPNQRNEAEKNEPQVQAGRPRCPQHVRADPVAFAAFKDAVRILKKRRTVSAGDAPTIAVYAVCYSTWVQAVADVRDRGFEIQVERTNKAGDTYTATIPNMSVRIKTDCERQLLQLAKALGMTPDTREKVKPTRGGSDKKVLSPNSLGVKYAHFFKKETNIQ